MSPSAQDLIKAITLIQDEKNEAKKIRILEKEYPSFDRLFQQTAIQQESFRKKALGKFSKANQMLFTAKSLEQSTSENIASLTASLYDKPLECHEICSGIGGNTIGLSQRFERIHCYESDPFLIELHHHNMNLYSLADKISYHCQEVELNHFDFQDSCYYLDPDRRKNHIRQYLPKGYSPDLSPLEVIHSNHSEILVKLSPMINKDDCPSHFESIYISENNELKQCLWKSPTTTETSPYYILEHEKLFHQEHLDTFPTICNENDYLYEINPAIIKSQKINDIYEKLGAYSYCEEFEIPYAKTKWISPFAKCYELINETEYHPKKNKSFLQKYENYRFEIKNYGIDQKELQKYQYLLKGKGEAYTLWIFKQKGLKKLIISKRLSS